jgi:hypothetical protein
MPLPDFDQLYRQADARPRARASHRRGEADRTVLEAIGGVPGDRSSGPGRPRGLLPWAPGKEVALPPPPPLRTTRECFHPCSSSLSNAPCGTRLPLPQRCRVRTAQPASRSSGNTIHNSEKLSMVSPELTDGVRKRRLGRGRGILPGRGELLLETSDGGLERLQSRLLGVQLRLQAPTVRARLPCRALGLMVGYATSLAGYTQHR